MFKARTQAHTIGVEGIGVEGIGWERITTISV